MAVCSKSVSLSCLAEYSSISSRERKYSLPKTKVQALNVKFVMRLWEITEGEILEFNQCSLPHWRLLSRWESLPSSEGSQLPCRCSNSCWLRGCSVVLPLLREWQKSWVYTGCPMYVYLGSCVQQGISHDEPASISAPHHLPAACDHRARAGPLSGTSSHLGRGRHDMAHQMAIHEKEAARLTISMLAWKRELKLKGRKRNCYLLSQMILMFDMYRNQVNRKRNAIRCLR